MWTNLSNFRRTRNVCLTVWKNNHSVFQVSSFSRKFAFRRHFNSILLPHKNHQIKYVVKFSTGNRRVPATNDIKKLLVLAKTERLKLAGNVYIVNLKNYRLTF